MVTKRSPKPIPGATEGFRKTSNFEKFSGASKQPIQRENGQVLTGKGPLGELTGGTWSLVPGPPPWVRGPIYKKKIVQAQVQIHTQRLQ